MRTFAASARSKEHREESGRSGHQPVFSVVQTQRTAATSPCVSSIFALRALAAQKLLHLLGLRYRNAAKKLVI
jgi:hypothetical protein